MQISKYSASGNDFIILIEKKKENREKLAKKLCHRYNGVGADGLIVIIPHKDYDFEWEFYNSDGSEANMCGNATRAVSHFAIENKISINGASKFLTKAGEINSIINGNYINVNIPNLSILDKEIIEDGISWWLIDSGVPHLVSISDNISTFDIKYMKKLRDKYNANINIVKIENREQAYIRTYEKGVENETLACGTGMIASFARLYAEKKSIDNVIFYPKSRDELYLSYKNEKYYFAGQVIKIFTAEVFI